MASCVELFAGAGGLAFGLKRAGFHHLRLIERDDACVHTINDNLKRLGLDGEIESADATAESWTELAGRVDLLAGGVPCQPFSFGGQAGGHRDKRNAFPETIRALRELQPRVILVENVKGFASETFLTYFEYVRRQIEMPEIQRKSGESWRSHRLRLNRALPTYARAGGLTYRVHTEVLQAADYGVPQTRDRLFIVGFRGDLDLTWSRPRAGHSQDRLLHDLYCTGEYWQEHGMRRRQAPRELAKRLAAFSDAPPTGRRWHTVRDAIDELPGTLAEDDGRLRHYFHPGARRYEGHDGSLLDWPAKTIKAGVHGIAGGENMLRYTNGRTRYFTLREAARLQSFPDAYRFSGSWTQAYRQMGNAVPVKLAEVVGRSIQLALVDSASRRAPALTVALRRLAP